MSRRHRKDNQRKKSETGREKATMPPHRAVPGTSRPSKAQKNRKRKSRKKTPRRGR